MFHTMEYHGIPWTPGIRSLKIKAQPNIWGGARKSPWEKAWWARYLKWGFPWPWGSPNSWRVSLGGNPPFSWMMTRGTPISRKCPNSSCPVGGLVAIVYFPINIGNVSSSQLTHSYFFRGVQPQPPTRCSLISFDFIYGSSLDAHQQALPMDPCDPCLETMGLAFGMLQPHDATRKDLNWESNGRQGQYPLCFFWWLESPTIL